MITYVDYSIAEAITHYKELMSNYPIIYYIMGAAIVFGAIILVNFDTRRSFIMSLIVNVLATVLIFYYRGLDLVGHIDSIFNIHFYQNIFFYYWNVIIGLFIMQVVINRKEEKIKKYIILCSYLLTLVNLIYSFYISNIMSNDLILVVGNIAPIIILGNSLLLITYLYLISLKIMRTFKRK